MKIPATLILENEEPIRGLAMGHEGKAGGTMVASTVAAGFPDLLTDPAYSGKIVCFTYPHVANAGVVPDDLQSDALQARAVIAREFCKVEANRLGVEPIDAFLKRSRVPAIEGVDTRLITEIVARRGQVRAVLGCGKFADPAALAKEFAAGLPDWNPGATARREFAAWHEPAVVAGGSAGGQVIVYDLGAKRGLLRRLSGMGLSVFLAPAGHPAAETLARKPKAVVFSSGPGAPSQWPQAVKAAADLLGRIPVFASGLGAGVVAAAAGAKIIEDGRAHYGVKPVGRTGEMSGEMTAQAHEFMIDDASLAGAGLEATHRNLNDNSVEGYRCGKRGVLGVLFHPEAEPGPHDSLYLFDRFAAMLKG